MAALLVATLAVVSAVLSTVAGAAPEGPPTGGCRYVGGSAVASPGPNRATVVIDIGGGDVVSACISFSGTITAGESLELAAAQIADLQPVYEHYGGQGRGICQLRGVGNRPPNCLSKSVEYWAYHHNGIYSRVGASTGSVADGDVDTWSWGRGADPRPASTGTETTRLVPPEPAPGPAPTAPPTPEAPDATIAASPQDRADPAVPGGTDPVSIDGATTSTVADSGGEPTPSDSEPDDELGASGPGESEMAVGPAQGPVAGAAATPGGEGSRRGSVVGFGLALAVMAVLALVVRRRAQHARSG